MKNTTIALIAMLFLTAAFGGKFRKLELGMEREQVVKLLGRPDGVQKFENVEALTYADRLISGFKWDKADYVVVLKDGLVSQYGPGAIRTTSPNTGAFVFIPL